MLCACRRRVTRTDSSSQGLSYFSTRTGSDANALFRRFSLRKTQILNKIETTASGRLNLLVTEKFALSVGARVVVLPAHAHGFQAPAQDREARRARSVPARKLD